MKRKMTKKIAFQKLTIAKLETKSMAQIRGGDCIPTEVAHTDWVCPGQELP